MATERVGIEIRLMGYKEARDQMADLDAMVRGLNGRRGYLRIKARVDELKMNKKALQAARVKVQAETTDVDRKIQRIRDRIRRLNSLKARLNIDDSGAKKVDARIQQLERELQGLGRQRNGLRDQFRQINNEIAQTNAELAQMQGAMRNAGLAGKSFGDIFRGASSKMSHIGQAMQSMGNAITRLTYPMRMFTSGALMGAGFGAMNKVTEGLKSGFSRYDTMKKYPKIMKAFGYSAEEAQTSIDKLDKSVRGLPTGLDEMVQMSQRFTATTGDIEKGTDLAIAANNAFLASMSTDTQRYQGMMQLQDVLGGKDMNAREWNSLVSSMTPAIVKMGESMGYTNKNMDEWIQKVRDGKVANEDFIDTLIKVGTEDGEVAKMANESKDTWQAFSANVTNAFSRMTAGVLQSLDQIVKTATGGAFDSLNTLLADKVAPGIDKLTKSAKDWIKANPDVIMDFVDSFRSVDWKGLGKGLLQGFGDIAKAFKWLADRIGGGDLQKIGRLIAWLPALGSALTIGGGLIKGGRHIIGASAAGIVGLGRVITALAGIGGVALGGGIIGKAIAGIKGLSLFSKAADGKKLGRIQKTMRGFKKFSKFASAIKPGMIIKGFVPAIEVIGGIGAVITTASLTVAANAYLIKKSVDSFIGIADGITALTKSIKKIKDPDFDLGTVRNAINSIYDVYDIIYGEKTGQKTRAANKAGTSMIQHEKGIADMSGRKLKSTADAIEQMDTMFGNMNNLRKTLDKLKGFKGFEEEEIDAVNSMIQGLGILFESMKQSWEDNIDAKSVEEFADITGQTKGMFDSIKQIADIIPSLQKSLAPIMQGGVSGMGMGRSPMQFIRDTLGGEYGLFAIIRDIYHSIYDYMMGYKGDADGFKLEGSDVEEMTGIMDNVKTMFSSISEMVSTFPELMKGLTPMMQGSTPGAGDSLFSAMKNQITEMMRGLGEIVQTINTEIPDTGDIETRTSGLATAMENIGSVVSKLASLGTGEMASTDGAAFTAISNIKTLISNLATSLNTDTIASLQIAVSQFKSSVDEIFATLNTDLSEVEVEVKIDGKVTGVDELVSDIQAADRAIRNAVNAVQKYYSRTINITLHREVNVTGTDPSKVDVGGSGGGGGTPWHTGGRIPSHKGQALYRAKGGDIFSKIFKPKGTDTVPAMLTPGEYVMRKKAVDTFGAKFMQRINHMDVAGAFRELSAKFGGIVTNNGGTYITNNITNNNSPTINQHINTNNPNFAYKRSSRYVMAL